MIKFIKQWYAKYQYNNGYKSARENVASNGYIKTKRDIVASFVFECETPKSFQEGYRAYLEYYRQEFRM